jgi:hypothetical protein
VGLALPKSSASLRSLASDIAKNISKDKKILLEDRTQTAKSLHAEGGAMLVAAKPMQRRNVSKKWHTFGTLLAQSWQRTHFYNFSDHSLNIWN